MSDKKDMRLLVGDRVVKNPDTWHPNSFDNWGAGVGIGIVVEPPFELDPESVDIRWPAGRCFQQVKELIRYDGPLRELTMQERTEIAQRLANWPDDE